MENVAKTSKFIQSRAEGSESSHEPKKKKLRQNNGNGDAVNTTAYVQFCSFLTTEVFKNVRFWCEYGEIPLLWVFKQWLLHKSGLITKILSYPMGLLLTLAGMGEGMSICGVSSDLKLLMEAMKSFIHMLPLFTPNSSLMTTMFLIDNKAVKIQQFSCDHIFWKDHM
ncbi:hypothetical protein NC651_025805 [Populus alba x Populus x berolinensis]|nr:hypothetical protein NC651_025805 [Populus alba x Populus x berolinensis]